MIDKKDYGLIVQDYRLAKDQEQQVLIMSQTYATSTAEIRKIIYDAGKYRIGRQEIVRALEILQEGGKNHQLSNIRNWLAPFKLCGAKMVKRILDDYREHPWAEPIPDEWFQKAFYSTNEKKDEQPEKPKRAKQERKEFDKRENRLIVCGLNCLIANRVKMQEQMIGIMKELQEKLQKAQREYEDFSKQKSVLDGEIEELRTLVGRMRANGMEENHGETESDS